MDFTLVTSVSILALFAGMIGLAYASRHVRLKWWRGVSVMGKFHPGRKVAV